MVGSPLHPSLPDWKVFFSSTSRHLRAMVKRNAPHPRVDQARCGSGGWEEVANTEFSHQTLGSG